MTDNAEQVKVDLVSERLMRVGNLPLPLEAQLELGEIYADVCALERASGDEGRLRDALRGLVREFEKFSRYGSPIAIEANEAMQLAVAALKEGGE